MAAAAGTRTQFDMHQNLTLVAGQLLPESHHKLSSRSNTSFRCCVNVGDEGPLQDDEDRDRTDCSALFPRAGPPPFALEFSAVRTAQLSKITESRITDLPPSFALFSFLFFVCAQLRAVYPQFDQRGEGGGHMQQDAEECLTQVPEFLR